MFNFVWDNNYSTYSMYVTKTVMNIVKTFILTSLLLFKILLFKKNNTNELYEAEKTLQQ